MAKAANSHTAEWAIDEAFRYLTRVIGRQDDLAIYELTEGLLAGRLQMKVEHFVDGTLKGTGVVPASWWRGQLVLHAAEGQIEVRPLVALESGEYQYALLGVELLWPRPATGTTVNNAKSTKTWVVAEVERLKTAGEIRKGKICGSARTQMAKLLDFKVENLTLSRSVRLDAMRKTDFARLLAMRLSDARAIDPSLKSAGYLYIKNNLAGWGLWPLD